MGFTNDTVAPTTTAQKEAQKGGNIDSGRIDKQLYGVGININRKNVFAPQDYVKIINAFETGAADWEEEDYSAAYHYKDVYSTRAFSQRVQDQLNQYPGLHQTSSAAKDDPAYIAGEKKANQNLDRWKSSMSSPESFMSGLRSRQQDFNYAKVFGSEGSIKDRAKELGKIHTECIPCFKRLLDLDGLVPNGDLIEIHMMNVKVRLDFLKDLKNLFTGPGVYIDICEILHLFSKLCPQDLFALSVLLTQFLAKLNLEVKFNIDFIISLVGSILSPFLDALNQWLDKWMQLILEPMICVVDHVNEIIILAQNAKIPLSEATGRIDADINIANMGHNSGSLETSTGFDFREEDDFVWAKAKGEDFDTPDNFKYNTPVPDRGEEFKTSAIELNELREPYFTDEKEREEQTQKVRNINEERRLKELTASYKEAKARNSNGTRWSKDDIPASEKNSTEYMFRKDVSYPERQKPLKSADRYWHPDALVSGVVQIRNIMQTAIAYINDWFKYISQMIYDLLGTEIGWMKNKTGTTKMKSEIIQILKLIKSIIQAINKNGLKCGSDTNLDPEQIKFITENELNNMSSDYAFAVQDNGDIEISLPGKKGAKSVTNKSNLDSNAEVPSTDTKVTTSVGDVSVTPQKKQSSQKSSIIVKSCFSKTDVDNIQKVQKWIDYYERRLSNEVNTQ